MNSVQLISCESHVNQVVVINDFDVVTQVGNTLVDLSKSCTAIVGHVDVSDSTRSQVADSVGQFLGCHVIFWIRKWSHVTFASVVMLPVTERFEHDRVPSDDFVSVLESLDREEIWNIDQKEASDNIVR